MSASRSPPPVSDCPRYFHIRRIPREAWMSPRSGAPCCDAAGILPSVEPLVLECSAVFHPASCSAAILPEPPRHCVPVLVALTSFLEPSWRAQLGTLPCTSTERPGTGNSAWNATTLDLLTPTHWFCVPQARTIRARLVAGRVSLTSFSPPPFFGVYLHWLSTDCTPVILPPTHACGLSLISTPSYRAVVNDLRMHTSALAT